MRAIYVLYEGVGSVHEIDRALVHGAHHPMGPLQLADFIGLDTCLSIMQVLYDRLWPISKISPLPAARQICGSGLAGQKGRARFLRLSRRRACPNKIGPTHQGQAK